ncbi:OmpA family protein [Hydrogenimonas cancrithermarum]|uniref:OmpA family lipoprotein n=1 Tax=Hydrogenimonas cancrithermarum TaxID=2993563 RepID=A0ABM8FJI0_9BACT|nr:OmpA family protein [Hydrogenimonas cancrithermarum]BDY12446.1 OmpA family lipoprotein [Hydrogenimonas cancrithermarum]
MKFPTQAVSFSLAALLIFGGCAAKNGEAPNDAEHTKEGVLIGTLVGAALGAVTSKHHKGKNVAIGAAIGAAAGGAIGYSLDKQAQEVADSMDTDVSANEKEAAKHRDIIVTKHDNYVKITFKSKMMFETDAADPTPEAREKIARLVDVLKKYPNTIVQVVGHTDSRGSYDYNLKLSQKRAFNVANMLKNLGVTNQIYARGCSFSKPLMPNDSPENMAINRRVEIYLYPSEDKVIDACR